MYVSYMCSAVSYRRVNSSTIPLHLLYTNAHPTDVLLPYYICFLEHSLRSIGYLERTKSSFLDFL